MPKIGDVLPAENAHALGGGDAADIFNERNVLNLFENTEHTEVQRICENPRIVPKALGLYTWWFKKGVFQQSFNGAPERSGYQALYVGIAPARAPQPERQRYRTLQHRLKNHCSGPLATSTVRRTLLHLLADKLCVNISVRQSGKPFLSRSDEQQLTNWMNQHARVSWIEHAAPWDLEHRLLQTNVFPLNIQGSSHPHSLWLRQTRSSTFR